MTNLHLAFLVLLVVVLLLVYDSIMIRRRVSTLERVALGQENVISGMARTLKEYQETFAIHNSRLENQDAAIRRLDEQTGKIAKRLFEHTDSRVAHDQGRLTASVERIQKAQFWTTQAREEAHVVLPNKAADEERPAEGLSPQ